jgi:prepilin-type N-terminal cleavage/methylation domain-containing protein
MAHVARRGFSLVEVMISVGVLGIGLAGLISLHMSSLVGLHKGQRVSMAQEIAMQQTEYLETEATAATGVLEAVLPSCPTSNASDPIGCRVDTTKLAPVKPCTVFVDDPNVPDPSGSAPGVFGAPAMSPFAYRADTVIVPHPDAIGFPNALVATVSVCWTDELQIVRQISTTRVIIPGT